MSNNINSSAEEGMPIVSPDGKSLYFVRTFDEKNTGGRLAGQDIWVSHYSDLGYWEQSENLANKLNNEKNNAVVGFSEDGNTIYLLDSYSAGHISNFGLAKSIKKDGEWTNPKSVAIEGIDVGDNYVGLYMVPNEKVLFISMSRYDSYGEEDIYYCVKDSSGTWSEPINMGPTINTKGFEISPFLAPDGKTLFFSSNGYPGFGDADIFYTRQQYNSMSVWSKPVNAGEVVNSKGFDAYLFIRGQEAYFASNRNSKLSEIYAATVSFRKEELAKAVLDPSKFQLKDKEIQKLMGMPVSRNIYFEIGSFEIEKSSKELVKFLASKLKDHKEYSLELIGHSSAEGDENFNMNLSIKRANEVARLFEQNGVSATRIETKGFGEKRPIYYHGSKEELAKNRRVEIYIVR